MKLTIIDPRPPEATLHSGGYHAILDPVGSVLALFLSKDHAVEYLERMAGSRIVKVQVPS